MESSLTRRCETCGYRFDAAMEYCPNDRRPLPAPDESVADLGVYRLVERLADGGMGAVYRAVHKRLGRMVAIKLLQRDLSTDRGIINRFFHEARAANTIRHEHVIEVYDFVETGKDVYFVMEFLRGRDLHDVIHGSEVPGPLDPPRAVAILEQIASALHATHARDIIHRDLKPENVFLAEKDGRRDFVKIFDFGVAKLDRPDGRSTIEGAVLGTPEYMAPEQARGGIVDARADIYSAGCIAYEMLTRRQVFGGGSQSEVLVRQLTFNPPPLRSVVPGIPAALDDAVMRALAKDPVVRPQTALEFAESLCRALGRGLENPGAFRTASASGPARVRTGSRANLVLRAERRPIWRPVVAGTIAAAAIVGAIVLARSGRAPAGGATETAAAAAPAAPALPPPAPAARPAPLVTVLLQSIPSGADVVDEHGEPIGVTPHDLMLPAGGERVVRFQKPGFKPVERRLVARADTTVAVRLEPEDPGKARPPQHPAGSKPHAGTGSLDSMAGTIDPFAQ
jgi:serine/threonine-protein kinase